MKAVASAEYRAYSIDQKGHISDVRTIDARSDCEAWTVAMRAKPRDRIELWCGAREVLRFPPLLLTVAQIIRA
jgi:hypothetical protein